MKTVTVKSQKDKDFEKEADLTYGLFLLFADEALDNNYTEIEKILSEEYKLEKKYMKDFIKQRKQLFCDALIVKHKDDLAKSKKLK